MFMPSKSLTSFSPPAPLSYLLFLHTDSSFSLCILKRTHLSLTTRLTLFLTFPCQVPSHSLLLSSPLPGTLNSKPCTSTQTVLIANTTSVTSPGPSPHFVTIPTIPHTGGTPYNLPPKESSHLPLPWEICT